MMEWLFQDSHCDSEFAYMLLFILLLVLAHTFAQGVLELAQHRHDQSKKAPSQANPTAPVLIAPSDADPLKSQKLSAEEL
jgi:hypothetical protein